MKMGEKKFKFFFFFQNIFLFVLCFVLFVFRVFLQSLVGILKT